LEKIKNIIAVICARGGSKGLRRKNIQPLLGKPLIAYTLMAALDSKYVNRVIVSTEDSEIADVAREYGAEVPVLRPAELATDTSPVEPVLKHVIDWLQENENYQTDLVVYMQITDIFRQRHFIDTLIEWMLAEPKLESAFVAHPTHKKFWKKSSDGYSRVTEKKYNPRQKEKSLFFREDTGLACVTRVDVIKNGNRLGERVKILVNDDDNSGIDIHTEETLKIAEFVLQRHKNMATKRYYY
jgi:CMP-N,N'-diacetyllegionaminic acid synthase